MSHNYAKLLSYYEDKGKLGLPEFEDPIEVLNAKAIELVELIRQSKCCVVFTGAGISTSSGIPDFRGPRGVWTVEAVNRQSKAEKHDEKEGIPENSDNEQAPSGVPFEEASPTYTHFALTALERAGLVKFLISQNVDGLHVVSGFPTNRIAELHGNVFVEKCGHCGRKYYRQKPIGSIGLKKTSSKCEGTPTKIGSYGRQSKGRPCRGDLHDTTLDWEDELPKKEYALAQLYSRQSDLSLCLGTTLQIKPVGDLPLLCKKQRRTYIKSEESVEGKYSSIHTQYPSNSTRKLVTVNLQSTEHEKRADLAIHGRLDDVFRIVMHKLGIQVEMRKVTVKNSEPVFHSAHTLEFTIDRSVSNKNGTETCPKPKRKFIKNKIEIIENNNSVV